MIAVSLRAAGTWPKAFRAGSDDFFLGVSAYHRGFAVGHLITARGSKIRINHHRGGFGAGGLLVVFCFRSDDSMRGLMYPQW